MIDELKTFIAVVDFKNFTRAGESINLSQPSVSTHIKNLESYFNTQLINRSIKQKNIVITESGYLLYKKAKAQVHRHPEREASGAEEGCRGKVRRQSAKGQVPHAQNRRQHLYKLRGFNTEQP